MSLKKSCGPDQFRVVDGLFRLGWERGGDLGNENIIVEELNLLGIDGLKLLEMVGKREIREELKNNVSMALSNGVFGVPTFIVKGEMFWGNDSIPHLELFLNGLDPLDKGQFEDFEKRCFTVF